MRTHEKIRKLREAKNYTQEYMAEELNISSKTYGRIESGESPLKVEDLLKISEILDAPVEDLLSSAPVVFNIEKQEAKRDNLNTQIATINNYGPEEEAQELKDRVSRLEAAIEKLLKQLPG